MRTVIDLPRPLLLRAVSRAARKRVPLSRYIAESLEQHLVRDPDQADRLSEPDPLFDELRAELGL